MPLTLYEREFLDAYVYEATNGPPFGGPATRALSEHGIWYPDLSWILTAYHRELCAEGKVPSGTLNSNPPDSPWKSVEEVKNRGMVLKDELTEKERAFEKAKQLLIPVDLERVFAEQHGKGRPLVEIWKDLQAKESDGLC